MNEFLNTLYYGNTVLAWAIAFGLIFASILAGRILYWGIGRWVKHLTRKTETKLDDIIIDMVEEPVVAILVLIGVQYAIDTLALSAGFATFIDNAFAFIITLLVAWLILRLYEAIHKEYLIRLAEQTESDLDDQILPVVRTGIRFIVIGLAIVIGLNNAGYDVGTILAGLGIGGLAFALAAQDTVANLFGGVTIFLQRPFIVGDKVMLDGRWLVVEEIGLRTSTLKDYYSQHTVFIPNSKFTSSIITNISRFSGCWLYPSFHLPPNSTAAQLRQALAIVEEVIVAHPHTDLDMVRIEAFKPEGVELIAAYLVDAFSSRHRVRNEIMLDILERLENAGIKLAIPILHRFEAGDIERAASARVSHGSG